LCHQVLSLALAIRQNSGLAWCSMGGTNIVHWRYRPARGPALVSVNISRCVITDNPAKGKTDPCQPCSVTLKSWDYFVLRSGPTSIVACGLAQIARAAANFNFFFFIPGVLIQPAQHMSRPAVCLACSHANSSGPSVPPCARCVCTVRPCNTNAISERPCLLSA
jgi:hypothetical protein